MKKVLITGANRGIGLELCRQLQQAGDQVVAVCRNSSEELDALGVTVLDQVDVSDRGKLEQLRARLGDIKLDWLINNAGVLVRDSLDALDEEGMAFQFQVNSMAPLITSQTLLPCLQSGSKIGIVTSRMGSVADNSSGGYYGYRMSKAAVNIAGVSMARDLQEQGICVGLLHPGMVATDMTGGVGVTVAHAASGLIARMEDLNMSTSGTFWHAEGRPLPW